jgi:hypothetical protein
VNYPDEAKTFNSSDAGGMRVDVESVDKITKEDIEEVFEGGWLSDENTEVSYLESMTYIPGGVGVNYDEIGEFKSGKWVSIGSEFRKVNACGKSAIGLRGRISNDLFFKFIHCYRWMCEKCGSKGGRINRRRFAQIIKKLNTSLLKSRYVKTCDNNLIDLGDGSLDLRQLVLTVPKELRQYFLKKEDITALCRIAERVFKKSFPSIPSIRYFHAFGDKEKGVYNPHVNIHGFEVVKKVLSITPAELNKIKEDWAWGLMGYLSAKKKIFLKKDYLKKVNIHYSFVESDKVYERRRWNKDEKKYELVEIEGLKLLIHRIEYMSRPCPGHEDLEAIKNNVELLKLFIVEMKGYRYVTNCGSWGVKDIDRELEFKEAENLAGEPLRLEYDKEGKPLYITKGAFDMKYRGSDYIELSEGFYRIVEVKRK